MSQVPRREVAHRVFAQEFRRATVQIEGEGEKDPNFVVTPLGAKINRLHVVGQCTDVEPVGESGDVWRARVSDGTGVFTVYAGQYQPEAANVLSEMQLGGGPVYVAVTGKARTYEPEPGSVFTSIRPETIALVDQKTRDHWIIDTARHTKARLAAVGKARAGGDPTEVRADLAEGAGLAVQHYGDQDITMYWDVLRDALTPLADGGEVQVHRIQPREDGGAGEASDGPAPAWTPPQAAAAEEKSTPEQDELDDAVMAVVKRLEGTEGARWDDILQEEASKKAGAEEVEESLNRLMDKGLVYEPTLGVLKTT